MAINCKKAVLDTLEYLFMQMRIHLYLNALKFN